MKWKPKNETCGVPGKGYIKAEDYSQEDENALIQRAANRKININIFMLNAGFEPVDGPQLEIEVVHETVHTRNVVDDIPKRKRRTKAEMEADNG